MLGRKEFEERIISDSAFKAKFAGIDSEDKFLSTARAEGYDLEQLDDEDLDNVAGGFSALKRNTKVDQLAKNIKKIKNAVKDDIENLDHIDIQTYWLVFKTWISSFKRAVSGVLCN